MPLIAKDMQPSIQLVVPRVLTEEECRERGIPRPSQLDQVMLR